MNFKEQAAGRAMDYVKSGMALGLGTGSATAYFVDLLGQRLQEGALNDIRAVPTSQATAARARGLGIPLTTLADLSAPEGAVPSRPLLDLAVDGADEVDPDLNLIKGLGRALLREKIVGMHARRFVVMVDESKLVSRLGKQKPLPVEVVPFEAQVTVRWLDSLGCRGELWLEEDGSPAVTDNGNYLARCWFQDGIAEPHALARTLAGRPGIIEHGLFLDMASLVIVAGESGVQILEQSS